MKKLLMAIFVVATLLLMPVIAQAGEVYSQGPLYYTIANQSITITGSFGDDEIIEVPAMIAGTPVNTIAKGAFAYNDCVKEVILPDTITKVEQGAFNATTIVTQKIVTDPTSGETETMVIQDGGTTAAEYYSDGENGMVIAPNPVDSAEVYIDEDGNIIEDPDILYLDETSEEETTYSSGMSPALIVALCVVAVIGVVVIVIFVKKQKAGKNDASKK